jgi:RHS repeat-associated protein
MRYNYIYDNQIFSLPTQVTSVLGYSSNTTYDYKLQVPLSSTDINNNTISFEYDWRGRLTKVISPNETDFTIKHVYSLGNTNDNIAWAKTMHYDTFNANNTINTVLFCDGLGRVIQTKKDIEINNEEKRVVSGKVIYDIFGRVISENYPKLEELSSDETTLSTAPEDNTPPTEYRYDVLDRVTKTIYPDGTSDSIAYDISDGKFRTQHIDALSNIVSTFSDYRNLTTKITNCIGSTTITYDQLGQKISTTDPNNIQTTYAYDMLGRLTSRNHPDAGVHTRSYDRANNLTVLDKNGSQIQYKYHYNRLTQMEYSDNPELKVTYAYGAVGASANAAGRVVKVEDINGWTYFEYDKLGNVSKETKTVVLPNEDTVWQLSMYYMYDSWGRIGFMGYPDGEVVFYNYDKGGNLKAVQGFKYFGWPGTGQLYPYVQDIKYNKFGKRTEIKYGNDIISTYQYDDMQRLSSLQSGNNTEVLQTLNYQYDDVGNITSINNTAQTLPNGLGGIYTNTYSYDDIYRLTNASNQYIKDSTVLTKTTQMQYMANGRITEKRHALTSHNIGSPLPSLAQNSGFNNYSYNNNKIMSNDIISTTFAFDRKYNNYQYDANGNMTEIKTSENYLSSPFRPLKPKISALRNLYWNEEDQLQAMIDFNNSAYYFYNYTGERTWKVVGPKITQTMSGTTIKYNKFNKSTYYLFPQVSVTNTNYTKHIFADEERICSKIGNGQTNTIPAPTPPTQAEITAKRDNQINLMKKVYPNMCIRTTPISCAILNNANIMEYNLLKSSMNKLTTPTTVYENIQFFYATDNLGSVTWVTNSAGNAIQHIQYLPFGELFISQQNSSFDSRYKFSGKELDTETGYSYFGARYLDSDLSIWLSVDPMADKYPGLSPYNYCANNPLIFRDPDGNRIIAVGAISQFYVKSYLKEHFGKSRAFKVTSSGEVKINQRRFDKQYKNASADQRILMDGLKEAINRKEVAQIHVNQESDNFELTNPIPGTDLEYTRNLTSDMSGGTIPPDAKFTDYYVLINDKRASNDELNATDGTKTGNSASSTFFHEVLDEFLNYFTKKTVDDNSSKADKVQYHNAALRNIGKKERDGSDHK